MHGNCTNRAKYLTIKQAGVRVKPYKIFSYLSRKKILLFLSMSYFLFYNPFRINVMFRQRTIASESTFPLSPLFYHLHQHLLSYKIITVATLI